MDSLSVWSGCRPQGKRVAVGLSSCVVCKGYSVLACVPWVLKIQILHTLSLFFSWLLTR